MKLGDGVVCLAMLVWLTVAVGPWWVGVTLFCGAMVLNLIHDEVKRRAQ